MDDNMYEVKNMDGLERVAHAMHMHEMWENARPHFNNLERNPANQSVCACVVDVESNGIMEHLRLNALKIREPELFYKAKDTGTPYSLSGNKLSEGQSKLKDSSAWLAWRSDSLPDLPGMNHNQQMLALFIHCRLKV